MFDQKKEQTNGQSGALEEDINEHRQLTNKGQNTRCFTIVETKRLGTNPGF